jgi:hypothetical protein
VSDLLTPLWQRAQPPVFTLREWELLLAQARRSKLLARLALRFDALGWPVPAGPAAHLDAARLQAQRQQRQVRWEVDRIAAALAAHPGPVVLLKGAAYAAAGLPPARGRLFSDVDVMVPRATLALAETQLLGGGWVHPPLDPYDERYYRQWMHELPPLAHVWRHTWLDVHHTITPPTSRWKIEGSALRTVPLAGSTLAVLAPEDMVLHSAVHLMQEGDFAGGLRDLLDLDDLLRHHEAHPTAGAQDFWPALLERAGALGLQVPLHHALQQRQRLLGAAPPPAQAAQVQAQVQALARGWPSRRLMPALLAVALRPAHPSCDSAASGPARTALYVRSHWLRMPWWRIVPHLARKAWHRLRSRLAPKPAEPESDNGL